MKTEDTNTINGAYFEHDMDEVKILPGNTQDDSDEEMAQQFGY